MADPVSSASTHFYEHRLFKATGAVIGLLAALWGLTGAPKPWDVASEVVRRPPPLRNTEIVVDASARMGAPFGQATKLAVAAEAVNRYAVGGDDVGLALRRAGGSCEEAGELLVELDDGNSDDIRTAARGLTPTGRSNIAYSVRAAIGDFEDQRFHETGSVNQVIVFVGGGDQCGEAPGQELRDELENSNVEARFRFFALKVSKSGLRSLKTMQRQLQPVARVEVRTAESVKQLYRAVREAKKPVGAVGLAPGRGGERQTPEPPPRWEIEATPPPAARLAPRPPAPAPPIGEEEEGEGEAEEPSEGDSSEEGSGEEGSEEEEPSGSEPLVPRQGSNGSPSPPPTGSSRTLAFRVSSIFRDRSMMSLWTLRPSGRRGRAQSLSPAWGFSEGSWLPTPPSSGGNSAVARFRTRLVAGSMTRS